MNSQHPSDWNVLTSPWLEVMNLSAETKVCSPQEALNRASAIRCITAASPLDLFAAHRFLLTLLYWKADESGGVQQVRESLLKGEAPRIVLDAIDAEAPAFRLFADRTPFLQDPLVKNTKKQDWKSAGSLFAEFASGTNIAHFHHGDDENMRLCLRCATTGMLRVIPWTQSGGAGLSPSIHNAPPIMAMVLGPNLAVTLGLNLVPLKGESGETKWSGHFVPTDKDAEVPYLEAFTWNPRRIHLVSPEQAGRCWGCGRVGITVVGPIVYLKNEQTKKRDDGQPFEWQDPAAFYSADALYTTMKSVREGIAASGRDLARLRDQESAPTSAIVAGNPNHEGWCLIIPCTNPANNKTFDHRGLEVVNLPPDAIQGDDVWAERIRGFDGWAEPRRVSYPKGAAHFVQSAVQLLTHADWAVLSTAACREMHDSPAAFDILSGLLWSLRGKVAALPSRNVAWLVLKLMAAVPQAARVSRVDAAFCPLRSLPKRQIAERCGDRSRVSLYPVSLPRGQRLEADLRNAIDKNLRRRTPEPIDWAGLCYSLDQLLD